MSDTTEFDALEDRLGQLAREITDEDRDLREPPVDLWAAIEADVRHEPTSAANVTSLDSRRRRRAVPLVLAAAAALLVAVVVGVQLGGDDDAEIVASVELVNDGLQVPNPDTATAELVSVDDGYALEVSVPDLPATEGYYELWVIDTDVEGMYSLGEVSGSGRYDLPAGVDPADFPVVDVSVEADDGDPTHGGQSIWRGVLTV